MVAGGSGGFGVSSSACVCHLLSGVWSGSLRRRAWRRACHDVSDVWNMLMMVASPFKGMLSKCRLSFPFFGISANFSHVYIGGFGCPKMGIATGHITALPEIMNVCVCVG